jgi:hypothetical protein
VDAEWAAWALRAFLRDSDEVDEDLPDVGALMVAEYLLLVRNFLTR